MSSKITLWSIGALFFSATVMAQSDDIHQHSPLVCGTPDISYEEFNAPIEIAAKIKKSRKAENSTTSEIKYIPIKMHLLGNDDGTGYIDENTVNDMLAELNKIFRANQNMEFFFSGTSFNKYADTRNNTKADNTGKEEQEFHNKNGANDAINVYVPQGVGGAGGYAYVVPHSQPYNRIHIIKNQLNDDKTTPHEFGHYFGLPHTFQNSKAKDSNGSIDWTKRELVTRNFNEVSPRKSANCRTAGDYFCDTEADPYGNDGVSAPNCQIQSDPDVNGDAYRTNMGNYMNYFWCPGYSFTPEQISKMDAGYTTMKNRNTYFNAPETAQPAPTNLTSTSGVYKNSLVLSWTDNSNVETGYIVEVAEKGTENFIPIGGVAANVRSFKINTNLDDSKEYVFRVKPSNSMKTYSEVSESFTVPKLCAATNKTTCKEGSPQFVINNFILKKNNSSILSNTNSTCTGEGAVNYYDTHQAKVDTGDTITFFVEPMYASNGTYYPFDAKVFCDWNNDGDFDDENELLGEITKAYKGSGTFNIPTHIPTGKYRLRVAMTYTGRTLTSCQVSGGEMEDYALDVTNTELSTKDVNTKDKFSFYPNPVSTEINIHNINNFVAYEIYDKSGRLLKNGKIEGKTIKVNELHDGTYILTVVDKQGEKTSTKFIKKK